MSILSLMKRMSFIAVLITQEMVDIQQNLVMSIKNNINIVIKFETEVAYHINIGQNFQFHVYCLMPVKMVISTHIQNDFKLLLMHKYGFSNQQFYYIFLFLISAQFIVHIENKTIAFQSAYANNVWIGTENVNGDVVLVSLISNIIMKWEHIL